MARFDRYAEVHKRENNAGPGDGRTTALQIIQDNDLTGKWSDKVVFITGCSSGIGIETARALKATGAKVYVTARDLEKGKKALHDILEPGRCELLQLKLDSLASVRACAADFQARETKLNVLINNAGVMAIPTRTETEDGFETQFGTNHLGHFLLFQLLQPTLLAGSTQTFHSRVVNVSSSGHRITPPDLADLQLAAPSAYDPWRAYGSSKTANVWMANQIERSYGSGNSGAMASGVAIHGYSLHPGGISTGLQVHTDLGAMMRENPDIVRLIKSSEQGAATTVWAAVAPEWEGTGGKFLEDVQIAQPAEPGQDLFKGLPGYAEWAYNPDGEARLWEASLKLVQPAEA